jgi:hypothetical protein
MNDASIRESEPAAHSVQNNETLNLVALRDSTTKPCENQSKQSETQGFIIFGDENARAGHAPSKQQLLREFNHEHGNQDDELTTSVRDEIKNLTPDELKLIGKVADDMQAHGQNFHLNYFYMSMLETDRRTAMHDGSKHLGETPDQDKLIQQLFHEPNFPKQPGEPLPSTVANYIRTLKQDDLEVIGKMADSFLSTPWNKMTYNSLAGMEVTRRMYHR